MSKNYNARAQPLFCLFNLLFSDVPVAVAVVVFLNSLFSCGSWFQVCTIHPWRLINLTVDHLVVVY